MPVNQQVTLSGNPLSPSPCGSEEAAPDRAGPVRVQFQRMCGAAKSLYTSANSEAHPWIKAGIARLPRVQIVHDALPTLTEKGTAAVDSVIDRLDNGITVLDGRVIKPAQAALVNIAATSDSVRRRIVSPAWIETVDSILRTRKETLSFKTFFAAAIASLESVRPQSFDQFQTDLRARVSQWDDRVRAVALQFYETAQNNAPSPKRAKQAVADAQASLQATWEHTFVTNAEALYARALEHYLTLTEKRSAATIKTKEFITSLRAQLAEGVWTDRLTEPVTAFFENAQKMSRADLIRVPQAKIASTISTTVTGVKSWLSSRWTQALTLGQRTVDYVLPDVVAPENDDTEQDEPVAPTLTSLASTTFCRVKDRVAERTPAAVKQTLAVATRKATSAVRTARALATRENAQAVFTEVKNRSRFVAADLSTLAASTYNHVTAEGLRAAPRRFVLLVKPGAGPAPKALLQDFNEAKASVISLVHAFRVPAKQDESDTADLQVQDDAVPL